MCVILFVMKLHFRCLEHMAKCSCQNELTKVVRESKLANATYQTVIDSLMKKRNESYISFETRDVYIKRFVQLYLYGEKQYKKLLYTYCYYENILGHK